MTILLYASLEVIRIEREMSCIARGHRLEVLKIMDAMHHVAMKIQEDGKDEANPIHTPVQVPASLMETTCAFRSMTNMSNTNMAAMNITKPTKNNNSVDTI